MRRYPVKRTKYCKTVGKIRVENIAEILQNLGFSVTIRNPESHGVDVWVFKEGNLVLVIEVLNWRKNVYMDLNRAKAIRQNFSSSYYNNLRKLLVFSFIENIENQMNYFEGLDIDFLELGFQTQPYYEFYAIQGLASGMRPNNLATRNLVKRKLVAYLAGRGLM